MYLTYLRIAIRNLVKNKTFSFINIFGLAVGLSCCLLIAAFLHEELGYDRIPGHEGQLYRLGLQITQNGGMIDYPDVDIAVGEGIQKSFPEVLASSRMNGNLQVFIRNGDKNFKEQHITFCDSNFLQLFSIPLAEGDAHTALSLPQSMVITRALAEKYFGSSPALGKSLTLGRSAYKITGIIDKLPANIHFHCDGYISMVSNYYAVHGHTWSNLGFYTYLLLREGTDPKKLEAKLPQLVTKYVAPEAAHDMGISLAEAQKEVNTWRFYLMPVSDIHLHSNTKYELEPNGDILYVYIFSALAIFILLLACVNFTNLSTASSAKRSREVGIRKVLGSLRSQLVTQFLVESVLLTLSAMLLALVIVYFLLPSFNHLAGKDIPISFFFSSGAILAELLLVLVVGIASGIYPSFFLSSYKITRVLKGASASSPSGRNGLASGLVVFQFLISTALIIATIIVYQQLHFMQNKKLGYDKDQVLVIQDSNGLDSNQSVFKEALMKDPRVLHATISRDAPVGRGEGEMDGSQVYAKENKEHETQSEIHANFFHVDYDYMSTLGMQMKAGRNFSKDYVSDSTAVVINEAAVRDLGWKNSDQAMGKSIISSGLHEYHVIGVVQDFNYASAKQRIVPVLMMLGRNSGSVLVKIRTTDIGGFMSSVKNTWNQLNSRTPFSYYFLDEKFASLYGAEEKTGKIFTRFAVVAVLIASLGLFGLVAFTTERRTKEVGIRKVLGASVQQVLVLLSREFILLVCIAFCFSIPLTWWAMHHWLDNFAYRISIRWWVFAAGGIMAVMVAMLTVSFQAIRAAIANPVKSLRTE